MSTSYILTLLNKEAASEAHVSIEEVYTGKCIVEVQLCISLENLVCLLFKGKQFVGRVDRIIAALREVLISPGRAVRITISVVFAKQVLLLCNWIHLHL